MTFDSIFWLVLIFGAIFVYLNKRFKFFSKKKKETITKKEKLVSKKSIDDNYNIERRITQNKVDSILEKINKKGLDSLTKKEKKILEKYSNK